MFGEASIPWSLYIAPQSEILAPFSLISNLQNSDDITSNEFCKWSHTSDGAAVIYLAMHSQIGRQHRTNLTSRDVQTAAN